MRHIALCFLLLSAFTQYAEAQVFKCTGANGKIVYSDRACDKNASGGMIMREPTLEEKIQEREEAYNAEMRKQDRRAIEQERELIQQQRREIAERREMMERRYQPQPKTYAQELAERNAKVRSVFEDDPKTSLYKRRGGAEGTHTTREPHNHANDDRSSNHMPKPSVITNCTGGFCHDNLGGVYHQHGNGTTMTGPNGTMCIFTGGGSFHCP